MEKNILHIRFNVNAIKTKTSNYERACYEVIFKNVPANLLNDCFVYIGTNTTSENEPICTIGLVAPISKLESIRQELTQCDEFHSVCAKDALVLTEDGTESLENNGIITEDGKYLKYQARIAYYTLKQENLLSDNEYIELKNENPPQRHGCLTTWLILVVVINVGLALFLNYSDVARRVGDVEKIGAIIGAIISVVVVVLIWNWKKIGFWILAVFTALGFIFSLIEGNVLEAFRGLVPLAVLYFVLQKAKDYVSGWDNLK